MSHWLDQIILEQAAHYGLTSAQHAQLSGAADYQELIDAHEVPEPSSSESTEK